MMNKNLFKSLNYLVFAFIFFWTLTLGGLLFWAETKEEAHVIEYAKKEARANFNKDVALRNWVAQQGGVYVKVSKQIPPNPYLSHLPNRDIKLPSGKTLTLMNPAYILRETMEQYSELYGIKGRITSLKPLNPINTPDKWERNVLLAFEKKEVSEIYEISNINKKPFLRYMKAFVTVPSCLLCHVHQGYKVGDIRGGVGVSIPLEPYLKIKRDTINTLQISYGLLWLLGMFFIGVMYRVIRKGIKHRYAIEKKLRVAKQKAQEMAEHDGLTGLANRRLLTKVLHQEVKRAIRNQHYLSILMLDIDHFKRFNDTHGHLLGDEVLVLVANAIQSFCQRPSDFAARFGGEEFILVLPQTDYHGAYKQAEKIRKKIATLSVANNTIGVSMSITVSIGIDSRIPQNLQALEEQINHADQALYKAKKQGRNQVV
jgi:diguanylate cyclase (GGDEF)-like protein